MPDLLASEERLGRFDQEVEGVKQLFVAALGEVGRTPEASGTVDERWQALAARIKALRSGVEPEDYDRDQLAALARALLDTRDLLDRDAAPGDPDVCDGLLIALERIRHVVRDALDEHVNGLGGDTSVLMSDLDRWLPAISDHRTAAIIGVDRRTLSRWRRGHRAPPRRLRLFARLVAILRHSWEEEGVVAWFGRSRPDLQGATPAALLDDPDAEVRLVSAARAGRSQYAT